VLLLAVVLAGAALHYVTRNFAMTTDTAELLSPELEWRRREAAFDAAFPQQDDLIVAVIDGAMPELAERAATSLADRLRAAPEPFRSVRRPEGGAFFERNGVLLLPLDEVAATTEQLIAVQPFLGPLAADPSLRGVMTSLSMALEGVGRGAATLADIRPATTALADAFEAVAAGRPAFFSWRTLLSGEEATPRKTRRFVLVQPRLDYGALEPGARASAAVRAAARELGLDPAHGVRLRLTGPVPLADEEFATLAEGAEVMTAATMLALLVVLWLAVRSVRYVAAILATTLLGLVLTAGLGLLAVGRFNLISVAFIPLFVGLGVDFAIQLSVRSRAERLSHDDPKDALITAGASVGGPLALAAAAIAAGFFAFLPTSYIGVSELGAISDVGMIIAFVLSVTLLPALLLLLRRRGATVEAGFAALAPVEAWLSRRRRAVLGVGAVAALVSCVLLPLLRFDFNPLNLRSPRVESMAALADLMADPDRTPNTRGARALAHGGRRAGPAPGGPAGGGAGRHAEQLRPVAAGGEAGADPGRRDAARTDPRSGRGGATADRPGGGAEPGRDSGGAARRGGDRGRSRGGLGAPPGGRAGPVGRRLADGPCHGGRGGGRAARNAAPADACLAPGGSGDARDAAARSRRRLDRAGRTGAGSGVPARRWRRRQHNPPALLRGRAGGRAGGDGHAHFHP
jgi:hopanoid biosynthesis associated RND transporter like protein HpnN